MELIVVWLGLAVAAGVIASSKNRSGIGYFFLGLALPLIGVIIAIGISKAEAPQSHSIAVVTPVSDPMKKCPACAELIKAEAIKCRYCGETLQSQLSTVPTVVPNTMGYCPGCSKLRGSRVERCLYCGNTQPVLTQAPS